MMDVQSATTLPAGTLRPGTRFGAYEVMAVLGSGAFGTVYEALRHPLKKRVALKVLSADMARNQEAVARFLREAETAAALRHPHIVDVQDLGSVDGVPFLAMEFLTGETLEDRLERVGRLTVEESVDLVLPILSAVAQVHEQGVVHRDLKPANVFITQGPHGDHPKLLDFGIAKVPRSGGNALTRTSAVLGTPSFMSPEQVREARDTDARSDVWSIAAILYTCVAGAVPFEGASMFETFDRILSGPLVAPGKRVEGVPPGFDEVVERALARDPAVRTPSVREFGRELLPFASPTGHAAWGADFGRAWAGLPRPAQRPLETTLDEHERPRRVLGAKVLLGMVTVASLVFGGLWAVRASGPFATRVPIAMREPGSGDPGQPQVLAPTRITLEAGTSEVATTDVPVTPVVAAEPAMEPQPGRAAHRRPRRVSRGIGNY